VTIRLVPATLTRVRPGIKAASPRRSVQHGNGNPNSSAAQEANYLVNGAGGRQASYHSAVDDTSIYIMVPLDEVTWQAADGSGPGNMNGYSCEMVEDTALWADPVRREKVIRNTADFMGRIAARFSVLKPEQHWDFNYMAADRHDCPNKLRYVTINGRKAWDIYVELWNAAKADELKKMGATATAPAETSPAKTYAKPVVIKALDGLFLQKYDTAPALVEGEGTEFIFVADVVEATVDTPRLQRAAKGAARVGEDIRQGERFIVTWLFKANDGEWYYLTPWWTRVLVRDTKRIADAPVIPGSERD